MRNKLKRPSPAMVVAVLALFVALGGSSYAALKIGSKQIRNNSVRTGDLRNNDIRSRDIRNNTILGRDVSESSLGKVPNAAAADTAATTSQIKRVDVIKAPSTASNADLDTAMAAATQVPVLSFGPFQIYGKCAVDTDGTLDDNGDGIVDDNDGTHAELYIKTSVNGAMFDGDAGQLEGDLSFLNTNSPEFEPINNDDTQIDTAFAAAPNNAQISGDGENSGFTAVTPEGRVYFGRTGSAAKNGTTPAGDGLYGPGDACLFWAELID
jgi:hypothetical protein